MYLTEKKSLANTMHCARLTIICSPTPNRCGHCMRAINRGASPLWMRFWLLLVSGCRHPPSCA